MRAERTLLPTVVELRSGAKHTAGARGPWGQPVAACQLPSLHRVTFGNAAISSEAAGGVRPARPHGLLPAIKHAHGNSNDSLVGDAGLCCTLQSAELTMLARPDVRKVLDRLVQLRAVKQLTLCELFWRLDDDGDRRLSMEELHRGLLRLGLPLSTVELNAMSRALKARRDGAVEFDAFCELLRSYEEQLPTERRPLSGGNMVEASGYDRGTRVQSAVRLPTIHRRELDARLLAGGCEQGTVLGPGLESGTVMVRFDSGRTLHMRPSQLVRARGGHR